MGNMMPAPGAAQSLERINETLRSMLEHESAMRIEARVHVVELAQALAADKPREHIKDLIKRLYTTLS